MRVWLRDLRIEKGLTMKNVADKLGISESYYCAIENGDRMKRMDVSVVFGLARALEIEPVEILQHEAEYMNV